MGNRGAVIGGRIVFNRMLGLGSGSLVSFPFMMVLVRLELAFLFLVLLGDASPSRLFKMASYGEYFGTWVYNFLMTQEGICGAV